MDISKITTYQSGVVQASAFRNLNKHFSTLLKEHDLTCMQWFVVGTILDAGEAGIKLTDLAHSLQTGLPFITNITNLLESKGMVVRRDDEKDSRSKFVSIVPAFVPECADIERRLREKMRKSIYQNITADELRTYIKVLYQLSKLT
ncbi:MAG TPA: MarR family transcriptional regulator [Candidatus Limnocylindrales bacterium]|nr:MarR family transcriptional regulator [Candidatus Limnocylindrales bacterium]